VGAADISQRYTEERHFLDEALEKWKATLLDAARSFDASVEVSGRVKSHRSVIGKIYRKPGIGRTWESLGDLVALKAIFPTQRAATDFTEWVQARTEWSPSLDEKTGAPDQLKYTSMQFDLVDNLIRDSRNAPIKIELQVRTAATDAWYVVDHRLRYKGTVELPDHLKRKLLRLTVLTELFDEEVEAVISHQAALPEYAVARLYERITAETDKLTAGYASTKRPEGLLEVLLTAYTADELEVIEDVVTAFLTEHATKLKTVLASHLHGSPDFVESRDWIYYEPESLLIAERSMTRPAMLAERIRGSDFEQLLSAMTVEFRAHLRQA
jgi:ppGpp synthetase/RelA/SpoT-type nucleotidyltranferase